MRVLGIALGLALVSAGGADSVRRSAADQKVSDTNPSSRPMADGKEWTVSNLNVEAPSSYCYGDAEQNCRRYGRLYTWESAQRVCPSLGPGWRLPTDDEWRRLAKSYGGVSDDSADQGRAAFAALLKGGRSGFDAVLGGNRSDGKYARLDEHGFYWTASARDRETVPFYNFGKNGGALHRQPEGDKRMAIFGAVCEGVIAATQRPQTMAEILSIGRLRLRVITGRLCQRRSGPLPLWCSRR